jgi:very-short-patch-repair endonuclease
VGYFPEDEVYYEGHGGERIFPGGFRTDFLNRTKKFIVEFNGDFWHCNPNTWKPGDYNRAIKMMAEDKWNYDTKRHKIFTSCGYRVITVWESAWLSDSTICIQKVLKQIEE